MTRACRESRPWLWPAELLSLPSGRDDHRPHVPAVRVPPDHATSRMAAAVRREERWKTAEILILRHQLAVLQRRQPRAPEAGLGGPGPAGGITQRDTESRRHGIQLLVTPDTIVRWQRDIVRRRWAAVHARQDRPAGHPPEYQGAGPAAGPGEPRMGLPPDPRGTGRPGSQGRARRPCGRSSRPTASTLRRGGPGQPGRSSCAARPRRSWHATSSPSTCSTAPRSTSWP